MSGNLMPARAVSPGQILRRELDARGWSQKDLAVILGRPPQAITEIVRGTKQITPETALSLAAAFGTSAEFWSNLEAKYRLVLAQKKAASSDEVTRKARLYDWVPVGELIKRGWLEASDAVEELESSVCRFLEVASVGQEPALAVSLRHSLEDASERAAQRAWVKRVEHLARKQNVGAFDAVRLRAAIPEIMSEAVTEEAVARVPGLLHRLGVRFVVVPHLPKTRLDGAAAFVAEGPVVALTMRFDRIDYFWFTLLHELAHLSLEHRGGHLDGETDSEAIDGEETSANELASSWLVSDRDIRAFAAKHGGRPSKAAVEAFAHDQRLHAGIVVGRLHHLKIVPFTHFRQLLVKVRDQLEPWADRV